MLEKCKPNGEIEFALFYFNSVTKLVINHRFKLEESFQEIVYMIDAWINNGSGWIIESIESQYINISTYRPLAGNSYIDLPIELRGPRKGLINIRNNDQKCFLWCHVRHINPSKEHTGEIKRVDKRLANNLDYDEIEFPVKEKDFNKIEAQNHVPCSFAYKIVCIDDKFSKPIVVYRRENAAYEFIKAILKEYKYCKKIMKKHFNKNLIMNEEEEYLFQQSNSCSICEKLIDNDDEKVRDHYHVTGKFRGATLWS